MLLERIAAQARQMGLSKLFVLTTRSIHWFQERGFTPVDIDLLPESKKQMYNYQRRSKGADGRPRLSPSSPFLTARDSATLIALSWAGLPPRFAPALVCGTRAKFLVSAQTISFSLAHRYATGCRQDVDWRHGRHPPCKDR
ncbi:N-acetylglutamate synthase [Klebsiella variicola]|uniref:N-acetylglutamate synthase n=1 Tax=Klebsiella variicola TaxID=244366 RepID=A0A7H4MRP6_KLEVA|nr:N-acetylglutamate synthase [Klebsiella variicola]